MQKVSSARPIERAGWSVDLWCRAAGIGRTTIYTIDETLRPASVKVGLRRIITESPKDWLARVAATQQDGRK